MKRKDSEPMWRSLTCPTHGPVMHRVEPKGETTCLQCLSEKVTNATTQGLSGQVQGIAHGVFLLSEDGGRTIAADIRNVLQPVQVVRDEIDDYKRNSTHYIPYHWVADLDATLNRLKALADAFDGK